jgi:hypothetical protein
MLGKPLEIRLRQRTRGEFAQFKLVGVLDWARQR